MDIASLLEVEVKEGKPSELHSNGEIADYKNIPDFSIRDIASVRFRKLHCTACDIHIGSAPAEAHNMHEHPILHVLLCTNCRNFYGDGTFEQGDDATDMFCRWCANGGNLYCCSYCSNTFCYACIKRNFDPLVRKKIERDEKWKCFVCNPADLYSARASCWALLQHVQTVTRILQSDRKMSPEEIEAKMNLDESQCCPHKSKRKRSDTPTDDEEEDETYTVPKRKRRRIMNAKRAKRRMIKVEAVEGLPEGVTPDAENPRQPNSNHVAAEAVYFPGTPANDQPLEDSASTRQAGGRSLRPRSLNRTVEAADRNSKFSEQDDEIPAPLLQCDQSMVEGAESLSFGSLSPGNRGPVSSASRMGITPVPTAHLLKRPVVAAPANRGGKDAHRIVRGVTPVYVRKFPPNIAPHPGSNVKAAGAAQTMPMVSIPSRNHVPQSANRLNVIQPPQQQQQGFVRNPTGGLLRQIRPRLVLAKQIPNPNAPVNKSSINQPPPSVIDLESDEDEPVVLTESSQEQRTQESNDRVPDLSTKTYPVRPDDGILTILSPTPKSDSERAEGGDEEKDTGERPNKSTKSFEMAIRGPTKSIDAVLDTLKNKLKKVLETAMIFSPDKELVAAKAKTRAVNRTIKRTVSELTSLSDDLISAYLAYKRECNKEPVVHTPTMTLKKKEKSSKVITLDMHCTRESEPESDEPTSSDEDSENSQDIRPVREMRPFRTRVHRVVEARPDTENKSVQVDDVAVRNFEKSIGYALLLKADYDPKRERDILRPVMVPDENFGKYEEQFISYLQHIEDRRNAADLTEDEENDPPDLSVNDLIEAEISAATEATDKPETKETPNVEIAPAAAADDDDKPKTNDENVEILDEHLEISFTTTTTRTSSSDSDSDSSSSDSEIETSEAGTPCKKQTTENGDNETREEKQAEEKEAPEAEVPVAQEEQEPKTKPTEADQPSTENEKPSENKEPKAKTRTTDEETVLAVRALIEEDSSENSNSNAALKSWKPVESDDECTVLD